MSFDTNETRPDIGSSIFVVFPRKFNAVVAAFSHEDLLYKLPCGKVEHRDLPGPESGEFQKLVATLYGGDTMPHADLVKAIASGKRLDYRAHVENDTSPEYAAFLSVIARNCAVRELKAEADIGEEEFLYIGQMAYTRPIYKRDKFLRQFHFFGILKKQNQLSGNCVENSEMGDPEYWDPVDVLKWDVPHERKLNPFHRIAFARCLIEIRDLIASEGSEPIPDFVALLKRVEEAGFILDEYETTIRGLIKARDPRT